MSENNATVRVSSLESPKAADVTTKARSCIVCRRRKVRCDKQSPCSNCRRANIFCAVQPNDKAPRWVRRLDCLTEDSGQLPGSSSHDVRPSVNVAMDRLRNLERLTKELRTQLEQAQPTSPPGQSTTLASWGVSAGQHEVATTSESPAEDQSGGPNPYGRLVGQQDARQSQYVGSAFWSRIVDELEGLRLEVEYGTGDDASILSGGSSNEDEELVADARDSRSTGTSHAFFFPQVSTLVNSTSRDLHPPPLEVPFLLEAFSENVNLITQVVSMPEITQLTRIVRSNGPDHISASQEALLFSIYYAAMASMEEDDVWTNFGRSKSSLMARYRSGLEAALARANCLANPDITIVQAFAIYISLARRHENPRYVYMLTALLVRMAQYLGLHRDGIHLENLRPFEIQKRRCVWVTVYKLDVRAAEDQGTELAIPIGSFDTEPPLNINASDLTLEATTWPPEHHGITDMTFPRIIAGVMHIHRELMTHSPDNRQTKSATDLHACKQLIDKVFTHFDREHLQHANSSNSILYWVSRTIARLVMAKLLLISFLPILFDSPSCQAPSSPELLDPPESSIRHDLFRAAIEVAEYNHALNAEPSARQWRWIYQTHTHWYSVVYLMLSLVRREWGPLSERAYVALGSPWLFPRSVLSQRTHRTDPGGAKHEVPKLWVPLRQLLAQVRRRRVAELRRLCRDAAATEGLETDDAKVAPPSSPGPAPWGGGGGDESAKIFVKRWRELVASRSVEREGMSGAISVHHAATVSTAAEALPQIAAVSGYQQIPSEIPAPAHAIVAHPWPPTSDSAPSGLEEMLMFDDFVDVDFDATVEPPLGMDVNWYGLVQSAQGMERVAENDGW